MTKKVYIALIQKDIESLSILAEALSDNDVPSPLYIRVSTVKAQDIINNLQKLAEISAEPTPVKEVIREVIVEKIVEVEVPTSSITDAAVEKETPQEEVAPVVIEETITEEEKAEETPIAISVAEETIEVEKEIVVEQKENIEINIQPEIKTASIQNTHTTTISDVIHPSEGRLLDSLAKKKVDSIKKCISMGDRFLFQRELFENNSEVMNRALEIIDSCADLAAAEQYIAEHFNWNDSETALSFYAILNRRFN